MINEVRTSGLKHQRRSAAMEHYAGLDVSVKETSVCVIDGTGKVIQEVKVATEPDTIRAVLVDDTFAIERIGLEAGPLSQWLYSGLAEAGLPVICVETRHMKAALSAQLNKSDRNDARGIAHMMRAGLYRPVHVKTLASQKRRMLLTCSATIWMRSPRQLWMRTFGREWKRLPCINGLSAGLGYPLTHDLLVRLWERLTP